MNTTIEPTHRHYKGGLYRKLHDAKYEPNSVPLVVYQSCETGEVWVRDKDKFEGVMSADEGTNCYRFEPLPVAPAGDPNLDPATLEAAARVADDLAQGYREATPEMRGDFGRAMCEKGTTASETIAMRIRALATPAPETTEAGKVCERCGGDGWIEIMNGSVEHHPCPKCDDPSDVDDSPAPSPVPQMTPERLAELRRRDQVEMTSSASDRRELLTEIDRLTAEIERLRHDRTEDIALMAETVEAQKLGLATIEKLKGEIDDFKSNNRYQRGYHDGEMAERRRHTEEPGPIGTTFNGQQWARDWLDEATDDDILDLIAEANNRKVEIATLRDVIGVREREIARLTAPPDDARVREITDTLLLIGLPFREWIVSDMTLPDELWVDAFTDHGLKLLDGCAYLQSALQAFEDRAKRAEEERDEADLARMGALNEWSIASFLVWRAESRLTTATEALRELVALKTIKERMESGSASAQNIHFYDTHKPGAWDAARATLATLDQKEGK